MDLKYLSTSQPGLRWLRSYYRENPQLDRSKALGALIRAEVNLREFPMSGERFEDFEAVREFKIQGTAFSLLRYGDRHVLLRPCGPTLYIENIDLSDFWWSAHESIGSGEHKGENECRHLEL